MQKLIALLFVGVVVAGIAGLAVTTERASAQLPTHPRIDLDCRQTVDPTGPGTKGEVTCSVTIDIPDFLTPPLPDTIKLTAVVTYVDVDGNGRPNHGDRLQCVKVTAPGGNVLFERCRPAAP